MPEIAIQVKNLTKKYRVNNATENSESGTYSALRSVSLEIQKGEIIGVIGKNGSGKSTLVSILSNVVKPSSGEVYLFDSYSAILEIGSGVHPELSGYENIFFYGYLLGLSRSKILSLVDSIIEFSEITKFIHEPVKHYSSGMYLRLALSVVLHSEVPILFIDEVLAAGDESFKAKVFKKFQETFTAKGTTIVMVSHNMNDILQLCTRCIYIKNGEIAFDGKPEATINRYISDSANHSKQNGNVPDFYWRDVHTAPGNEVIKLYSVRIETKNNDERLIWGTDFCVVIEFWKISKHKNVQPSVLFKNYLNQPSFVAASVFSSNIDLENSDCCKEKGLYRFLCKIPGTFINSGFYTFQIRFGIDGESEGYVHNEIFELTIEDNKETKHIVVGPNTLRPNFVWEMSMITNEQKQ
jgi:lipopolysaccharide transport system ATP-binding protein